MKKNVRSALDVPAQKLSGRTFVLKFAFAAGPVVDHEFGIQHLALQKQVCDAVILVRCPMSTRHLITPTAVSPELPIISLPSDLEFGDRFNRVV